MISFPVLQKALEEGKDRIEESIRLHDADQILIAELRYQVEQLQIELEVRRQDLIIQRDAMNSERERSENERTENNRLETKRIEELKMKIEESLKIKNEQSDERRKVDRSETFIEFYNKNIEASKARDEQIEQEKKNEIFLKQQQILLDEAVRVPSIPSVGKSQDDKPSEVDVNFAGQIRYVLISFCTLDLI